MTDRLYFRDSHIHEFDAAVTACEKTKKGWVIRLDRSAFFPEGGGQLGDTGYIADVRVSDTQDIDSEVFHYTDRELAPGTEVHCVLDWEQRLRRMQNHSGEHLVSGIIHNLFGYNNVGFHMGEEFMTIDVDGELTADDILRVETLANEAVRDDLPVRAWFPEPEELKTLKYRSKKEITEALRIVEFKGVDICACCAPHVAHTGEIGLIKLLESERHRGGMRLSLICGMDALENVRRIYDCNTSVSVLLSSKRAETAEAVERIISERDGFKERVAALSMELIKYIADSYESTEGNICIFNDTLDEVAQRELVNLLMEKCRIAAAFVPGGNGVYRYIIGSKKVDLRKNTAIINDGIGGRGGGRSSMITGSCSKLPEKVREFMENLEI